MRSSLFQKTVKICSTFLLSFLSAAAVSGQTAPPKKYNFSIKANSLNNVLKNISDNADIEINSIKPIGKEINSTGLQGTYTLEEAFALILSNLNFKAIKVSNKKFIIISETSQTQSDGIKKNIHLETLKVRTNHQMYRKPDGSSHISHEQFQRINARNAADILSSVSGVSTNQSRQELGISVNIRGLEGFGRVNMMIDGARQNFQKSGHGSNGTMYLDPQLLSTIDVTKGPSSTAGGAGVVGGIANFKTLDADDLITSGQSWGGRAGASSGTNGFDLTAHAALAGNLNDNISVLGAISRRDLSNFEKGKNGNAPPADISTSSHHGTSEFTEQDQWSALLKTQWQITENQSFKVGYVGLKGYFDEGSNTALGLGANSINSIRNDTLTTHYHWKADSALVNVHSSAYYTKTSNEQFRPDNNTGRGDFAIEYATETLGGSFSNRSQWELEPYSSLLTLELGGEFFQDWTDPNAQQQSEGDGVVSMFVGPTPEGERYLASAFSQLEWSHAIGIDVLAGLRYDYFSLEGEGRMLVGSVDNPPGIRPITTDIFSNFQVARHQGFVSPSVTLAYQINDVFQIFASQSKGARPPAITESLMWGSHVGNTFFFFPNPNLDVERSTSREIGINLVDDALITADDSLNVKVVWFNNIVDNFITQAPILGPADTDDHSNNVAFVNFLDKADFSGTELQFSYRSQAFFTEGNWTHTMASITPVYDPFPLGSVVGFPPTHFGTVDNNGQPINDLPYARPPKHSGSLTLGGKFFEQSLTVGSRIRVQKDEARGGSSFGEKYRWTLFDAWVSYQWENDITFKLSGNNLKDTNYAENAGGPTVWIGPGRSYSASLTYRF